MKRLILLIVAMWNADKPPMIAPTFPQIPVEDERYPFEWE